MANLTTESNIEFDGSIPFSVVHGTKVAAGVKILRGGMVFEIDGVLFKAGDLTQAPLLAKILSVAPGYLWGMQRVCGFTYWQPMRPCKHAV